MDPDILSYLHSQDIRFVRIVWCDNANVIRSKAIHVGALPKPEGWGIGLSAAQQGIPVMADALAPNSGLSPVGEVWLVPDWSTLQLLPYAPGQARVMGSMVQAGEPWPWCGRQFLRRMVGLAEAAGLSVQAAFEPEFFLLPPGEPLRPSDDTVFAASLAMDIHGVVITAIADALTQQGLTVEQYYPESGPGQQEISIRYGAALTAADQHIIYRETVKAVARQHGQVASFVPKIFPQAAGSGCHLHFSLWRGDTNLTATPAGLTPETRAFMAGILTHLPALMALTTPTPNSYRRLQPQCWSGAFRVWGYDNREAALRVPSNPLPPSPTHLELKTVDSSANPYLVLGAVIAAGLDGLAQGRTLPEPVQVDPGSLSEAQRRQQGIERLPDALAAAIAALGQNAVLRQALGEELFHTHLALRRAEDEALGALSLEQEVALLLERY